MTDFVMIVRLRLILFWLLTSTCVIGAKQLIIKDIGPSLPALVSYDTIHKAFNDESSNVYLAQTHDLHTSADQKHLSNSAEFNKIAAKQSLIPFLAYSVATNKADDFFEGTQYTTKVRKQMEQGDFHSFPESVKGFQDAGKVTPLKGGDGVTRQKLEIPGSYKNKDGNFEFIKEPDGSINHRFFRPE